MLGLVRFSDYRPAQAAELVTTAPDRASLRRIVCTQEPVGEWEATPPLDGEDHDAHDVLEVFEGGMYTWQIVRRPLLASDVLLRLAAKCPLCGARPAMRVAPWIVQALRARPATDRVGTYQCQRRGCGAVYDLTADAYQRAA